MLRLLGGTTLVILGNRQNDQNVYTYFIESISLHWTIGRTTFGRRTDGWRTGGLTRGGPSGWADERASGQTSGWAGGLAGQLGRADGRTGGGQVHERTLRAYRSFQAARFDTVR